MPSAEAVWITYEWIQRARKSQHERSVPLASVLVGDQFKPTFETYASIAGGTLWGYLAFRTRSLLSGLMQHFLLGPALDWFICYG